MDAAPTIDELIERERACGVRFGPFWQAKYLERAPEKVRRELELGRRFPHLRAMRKYEDAPASALASDVPATSFSPVTAAVETNLWDPSVWAEIPAEDPAPGTTYLVCFGGIYSNRTTTTPASTWTPRWGQSATPASNTTLGASAAVYSGAALTNVPLYGEFTLGFRSVGTSGTAVGSGFVVRGNAALGAGTIPQTIGGTVATIDTTVAAALIISHTWSAANAANTLTVQWLYLKAFD